MPQWEHRQAPEFVFAGRGWGGGEGEKNARRCFGYDS